MAIIAADRATEGGGAAAGRTEDGGATAEDATADGAAAEDATADGDMGEGQQPGAAEVESLTASVPTEILTLFCQVNHQLCGTS